MFEKPVERRTVTTVPLFALALSACRAAEAPVPAASLANSEAVADTVFINGRIFTADTFSSVVEAVAIRGGTFAATGTSDEISRHIGPTTAVHDLAGAMAMPGITDMHVHPVRGGLAELTYCRFSPDADVAQILEEVRACAEDKQHGEWVEGAQWDSGLATTLDKASLDEVAPNNPVYLHDNTNHVIWVNSAALAAAGIDSTTPDPPGGRILRDPATGEPTGVLMESAIALVHDAKPEPSSADIERAAAAVFARLNAYGVTSIQTGDASATHVEAMRALEEAGLLTLRVHPSWDFNTPLAPLPPDKMLERFDTRAKRGPVTNLINPDGGKIYADGIPNGYGSPYLEPYLHTHTHGHAMVDQDELDAAVRRMDELGLKVKIHAMGDAAVRMCLDAFERARRVNGATGPRHVLAHTFSIDPQDIGRAERLNVVFEVSPPVILYPNDLTRTAVDLLGPERVQAIAPIRSLLAAGDTVAYGSDWDNIPEPNPWFALQAIVTRRDPFAPENGALGEDEAVDVATALRMLTYNGAYGLGLEDRTGSIEVGKDADLVVLSQNVLEVPASDIYKTQVTRTVLQGKTVYLQR